MNKKIYAIAAFVVGLGMVGYALHGMGRISAARSNLEMVETPFSQNPLGKRVTRSLDQKIGKYEIQAKWLLAAGVLVALAGGYYYYRNRR